jgi:predicted Zn-dependent protease
VRYRFYLVNSDVVNAFAIPGGYVYVTRGIVERAASMDQLAGVLGHEMGHVEYRHSAQQIGRQQAADLGVGLTSVLLQGRGEVGQVATRGAGLAAQGILMRYSRDQEREADRAAVAFTTRAGINPDGIVEFFRKLKQVEGREPNTVQYFFASHPLTEDRIAAVTALIAADRAAMDATRTGQHDSPEFQDLRARVMQLPPPADRHQTNARP